MCCNTSHKRAETQASVTDDNNFSFCGTVDQLTCHSAVYKEGKPISLVIGVALPLRKIATLQNPVMDISEEDGHYIAKQITVFKTHVVTFLLDTELDEETPDGRRVKVSQSTL